MESAFENRAGILLSQHCQIEFLFCWLFFPDCFALLLFSGAYIVTISFRNGFLLTEKKDALSSPLSNDFMNSALEVRDTLLPRQKISFLS